MSARLAIEITPAPRGFAVRAGQRTVTEVERRGLTLVAAAAGRERRFPFGAVFPALAHWVAAAMAAPDAEASTEPGQRVRRLAWRITPTLARHVDDLRAGIDPLVLKAQGAVLKIDPRLPTPLDDEELWKDTHLLRDIAAHRAAAIAAAFVGEPSRFPPIAADPLAACDEPVRLLHNWRGLYSPDGKPYRSLDRTLMNLPRGIDAELVPLLRLVRLERPLTDPLELRFVLLHARRHTMRRGRAQLPPHQRVVARSRATEIRQTLQRYGRCLREPLSARRDADLERLAGYVSDFPHEHRGRLGGLFAAARHWHRQQAEARAEAAARRELAECGGAETPTALPPIALPHLPGLTFLDTAGAVVAEGRRMRHCVASMATEAVAGSLYLFHVEHAACQATVAVTCYGEVLEAAGPDNRRNTASDWGTARLEEWGAPLGRRAAGTRG